jgi:hypothetical protein
VNPREGFFIVGPIPSNLAAATSLLVRSGVIKERAPSGARSV